MTNVIVLIAVFLLATGGKQEGLQDFNVSGIQCRYIAKNVTPRMVERDVNKYVDTCIQWEGRVARIAEADPNAPGMKAWVVSIDGRFDYWGSTILQIDLTSSGKIEEYSNYRTLSGTIEKYSYYRSLQLCDYLYSHGDLDIRSGDLVSFTGRILGISKKPDPVHKGSSIERALIGITEIHKLLSNIPLKTPLPPG